MIHRGAARRDAEGRTAVCLWRRRRGVPALVAGATEALGPDRAGIAAAVNNTARQIGGAIGVALIGGFATVSTALAASGALGLGGVAALTLMSRGQ